MAVVHAYGRVEFSRNQKGELTATSISATRRPRRLKCLRFAAMLAQFAKNRWRNVFRCCQWQTFCWYSLGSSPEGPGLHGIALKYV